MVMMRLSSRLLTMGGVKQAMAMMATPANKAVLAEAGLLVSEVEAAEPNDLVIVVAGEAVGQLDLALGSAQAALSEADRQTPGVSTPQSATTLRDAVRDDSGANVALISTPGTYAAAEALKALKLGLHTMIFSSDVSLQDEIALKKMARKRGLLVMGPDCGTAILGGYPLAFANVVPRGDVGIVAASGSGLQELSCQLSRHALGVSQAIGTGSRDLSREVGGITMLQGYEALLADENTRLIVLLSKPPHPEVAQDLLHHCTGEGKPLVLCFLGMDAEHVITGERRRVVRTIEQAVQAALALLGKGPSAPPLGLSPELAERAQEARAKLQPAQRHIRGLFSGGTLCSEAQVVLSDLGRAVYSNVPLRPELHVAQQPSAPGDVLLDVGTEEYTVGRPHPMIDFRARRAQITHLADNPNVGVLLLDVILGYGAHADPAGELVPAIQELSERAARVGRHVVTVASVCGTVGDPQGLRPTEQRLLEAGVLLAPSAAQGARLAHAIVS